MDYGKCFDLEIIFKKYMNKIIILLLLLTFCKLNAGQPDKQLISEEIPCSVFPSNNIWNTPVDELPLDPNSALYVQTIGAAKNLHPDFGSGEWNGAPMGIPYILVSGNQPKVNITFEYSNESDNGLYPIPDDPPIEGGPNSTGDRHVLIVDKDNCILYEIYSAYKNEDGTWRGGSGAIFDFNSNTLRPDTWTSADAAGLPILPGLVRYDDVAKGEINHAIRFTVPKTRRAYLWPARHYASSLTDVQYPPMGQRFRLKKDVDISSYSAEVQIILKALKKYGMILADNGSQWYISGAPDPRWVDDDLGEMRNIKGSDFEAVDCSSLMIDYNSGEAKQTPNGTDGRQETEEGLSYECYPNPFTDVLSINFNNPILCYAKVSVYNILGSIIKVIDEGEYEAGNHKFFWDGRNDEGKVASGGFYFINMQINDKVFQKAIMYIK